MTLQPDRLRSGVTHHVWFDQPGHRIALAVCGYIMVRRDSVEDPTCPTCRAILAAHDRELLEAVP